MSYSSLLAKTPYSSIDYSCLQNNSWQFNFNHTYNYNFNAMVGINSMIYDGDTYSTSIDTTGIVEYDMKFTQDMIDSLNSQPLASEDFVTGRTTAVAGNIYTWGDNIGYITTTTSTEGCNLGYWPPGPVCPAVSVYQTELTLQPAEETSTDGCYSSNGPLGLLVNGANVFNWNDATLGYDNQGVWLNNAPIFEYYDMDVCFGHSADGMYHHHNYPPCLGQKLGDDGSGHSPVYGFIYDGFPIYGPYNSKDTTATSCWQLRDYASTAVTGCADGQRSCQLVDMFDYTKGVYNTVAGPVFDATVYSQSGNPVTTENGVYFGDYFYNSTCYTAGDVNALDKHNGHDHDGLGYHYHFTFDIATNKPVFPYVIGPTFYGCLQSIPVISTTTSSSSISNTVSMAPMCCTFYEYTGGMGQNCNMPSTCSSNTYAVASRDAQCTDDVVIHYSTNGSNNRKGGTVLIVTVALAAVAAVTALGFYCYYRKARSAASLLNRKDTVSINL